MSEYQFRQQAFWEAYVALDPATAFDRRKGRAGFPNRWRTLDGTDMVVSRYIGASHIGLFLRGDDRLGSWGRKRLEASATLLTPLLDTPLGAGTDHGFSKRHPLLGGDPRDAVAIAWLIRETARYEEVALAHLQFDFGAV